MNYYEDHSISSSHADETDERRSTISVSPEASAGEEPFSFFGLLCYADTVDWLLMALGTIGSIIHGIAFPVGYLLLGKALDAFGTNINDQEGMVHALYKVNLLKPLIRKHIISLCPLCCFFNLNYVGLLFARGLMIQCITQTLEGWDI